MAFGVFDRKAEFDPRRGASTVHRERSWFRVAVRSAFLVTALFAGMTMVSAGPAFAGSAIVPKRSVAAPLGFQGVCSRYAWACSGSAQARISDPQATLERAIRVNRSVNNRVRQVSDMRQYRREEHWALPTARGGDCEDFALLKKHELIEAGIAPNRLLMATVLDRKRNAHAVLVVRTGAGDYVLDNLTNRVKLWDDTGYSFIRIQNADAPRSWNLVLKGGLFG